MPVPASILTESATSLLACAYHKVRYKYADTTLPTPTPTTAHHAGTPARPPRTAGLRHRRCTPLRTERTRPWAAAPRRRRRTWVPARRAGSSRCRRGAGRARARCRCGVCTTLGRGGGRPGGRRLFVRGGLGGPCLVWRGEWIEDYAVDPGRSEKC